ncbi:MAG: GNAT family N-acetyltransferase [Chloroflexi bacterium]|nr:GNAT family N-acetyltransferase [Chloroflexota bacterium]
MIYDETVALRLVEIEDLPLLAQWRNAQQGRMMFFTPFMVSPSGQLKWYERIMGDPTQMQFTIIRLEDAEPIGTIGLTRLDQRNQDAEFGNLIMSPDISRRQWGVPAAITMIRYAFRDLNLHRIHTSLYSFDTEALADAEAIGFQREAVARRAAFVNGAFHDVIHMAILRDEWPYLMRPVQS